MKTVTNKILQAILPARCPLTGDVVEMPGLISAAAWGQLDFIVAPLCVCCGLRFDIPVDGDTLCPNCVAAAPAFDRARAVLAYDDASRDMVLAFKHADQTHLVKTFGPWLVRVGAEMLVAADMIVPVPLHRWRLLRRRYNQAGLIAQDLAKRAGVPYRPDILVRGRSTPSQGHLTRAQRFENVSGAFQVPEKLKGQLAGKHIVLVDDVFTTGATVEACAHVLKRAGAASVSVLTLARVIGSRPL